MILRFSERNLLTDQFELTILGVVLDDDPIHFTKEVRDGAIASFYYALS